MLFRYVLCVMLCLNVCMMCSRVCCAWMLGADDLPLNVHVWRVHQMHQVHQINQVIIFSVGTQQFGTKFMKNIHENRLFVFLDTWWWVRRVDDGVNVGSWRFTSKCSCLKSALDAPSAPDKSSHNFFSRHTAIRHKICEKYS